MANIKISQLPAKGANLASTDLVEVSEFNGSGYVSKSITGAQIVDSSLFSQEASNITTNGNNAYIQQGFSSNTPQNINLLIESRAIGLFKNYKHIFTKFANISSLSLATGSGITTFNYNNEFFAGVNFPSGTFTYNIASKVIGSCNNPSAGTINFPNLTLLNSVLTVGSATVTANNLIACTGVGINGTTAYGLNSLEAIAGTLQFVGTPSPTFSIASNMPALKYIQTVQSNANSMTSINLDGALYIQSVSLFPGTNPSLLTTFSFANIKELGGNFQTNTTIGLNQTSVDHILVKLASLDGTNGTCFYGNRTVTVRGAAPSATGLAAKATLISRGCSVTTS